MGDISSLDDTPLPLDSVELSTGWTFRQTDDERGDWLPVKRIPSTVHQDLIDNNRCHKLLSFAILF